MSVVHPYQPMHQTPIASEAQVAAMHAKLKARIPTTTPTSQPSGAGESPQAKSALVWNRPTTKVDTAVKTNCGRYCCCKVTVQGKTHYELWKLAPGAGWFNRIDKGSGLDNFLQAQVLAQQDADKSP